MSQIKKKWVADRAIDHTKLDSSDSFTMKGLAIGPSGSLRVNGADGSAVFSVNALGDMTAHAISILGGIQGDLVLDDASVTSNLWVGNDASVVGNTYLIGQLTTGPIYVAGGVFSAIDATSGGYSEYPGMDIRTTGNTISAMPANTIEAFNGSKSEQGEFGVAIKAESEGGNAIEAIASPGVSLYDSQTYTGYAVKATGDVKFIGDATVTGKLDAATLSNTSITAANNFSVTNDLWVGNDASVVGESYLGSVFIASTMGDSPTLDVTSFSYSPTSSLRNSGLLQASPAGNTLEVFNDSQNDSDEYGNALIVTVNTPDNGHSSAGGYAIKTTGDVLIDGDATITGKGMIGPTLITGDNNESNPALTVVGGQNTAIDATSIGYVEFPTARFKMSGYHEHSVAGNTLEVYNTSFTDEPTYGNAIYAEATDDGQHSSTGGFALRTNGDIYVGGDATAYGSVIAGTRYAVDSLQVAGRRIIDTNLDISPATGDTDTNNLILSLVDIIKAHGLGRSVSGATRKLTLIPDGVYVIDTSPSGSVYVPINTPIAIDAYLDEHGSYAFEYWSIQAGNHVSIAHPTQASTTITLTGNDSDPEVRVLAQGY